MTSNDSTFEAEPLPAVPDQEPPIARTSYATDNASEAARRAIAAQEDAADAVAYIGRTRGWAGLAYTRAREDVDRIAVAVREAHRHNAETHRAYWAHDLPSMDVASHRAVLEAHRADEIAARLCRRAGLPVRRPTSTRRCVR